MRKTERGVGSITTCGLKVMLKAAMAKVTGGSAVLGVWFLGKGDILRKLELWPLNNGIKGDIYQKYMAEMRARGINVLKVNS